MAFEEFEDEYEFENPHTFKVGDYEISSIGGNDYCIECMLSGYLEIIRNTDEDEIEEYLLNKS